MELTLQFVVMVNSKLTIDSLVSVCLASLAGSASRKQNSFDYSGNWIEVRKNDDFDTALSEGEDGFLHLRYRVEATPIDANATVDQQVVVAREICESLARACDRVVLCANFEDRIPQFADFRG